MSFMVAIAGFLISFLRFSAKLSVGRPGLFPARARRLCAAQRDSSDLAYHDDDRRHVVGLQALGERPDVGDERRHGLGGGPAPVGTDAAQRALHAELAA